MLDNITLYFGVATEYNFRRYAIMVHKDGCPPSPESTGCYLMLISFGVD